MPSQQPEIWLPTTVMTVSVVEGEVSIREDMTMEKKKVKRSAGFAEEERNEPDA